jgi:hypothetical protein
MPKQKRVALKRLLTRSCEDIERAQVHLVQVYAEFEPVHPDRAEQLYVMGQALGSIFNALARFRDEVI